MDLTRNWTFQPPLTSGSEGGEEDIEIWGLEYITAEELEAEFDRLQLRKSHSQDTTQQQVRPLPGKTPPPATELHEVYDLKGIDAIRKGVAPQSAKEATIRGRVEQPGAWNRVDCILRGYQVF